MGKLTRPILPEVFPRRRLFGLLDRMRQKPLIWVSGPGGCGKTTLVSSSLQDQGIPGLWYQVEEGDKDPATFFYYLGQAAKKAFSRRKTPLPLFTPEYSRGLPIFTQNYFENLFTWINSLSPSLKKGGIQEKSFSHPPLKKGGRGGFVLVFDNFQEAPEESPLPEILLN